MEDSEESKLREVQEALKQDLEKYLTELGADPDREIDMILVKMYYWIGMLEGYIKRENSGKEVQEILWKLVGFGLKTQIKEFFSQFSGWLNSL